MGNGNNKQAKEHYPMMEHYAKGGKRASAKRSSAKKRRQSQELVKKRRSSLLEKRNTPARNSGRASASGHNIHQLSPRVRSERSSNRYEGLGDVRVLSATARRRGEGRPRTSSLMAFVKDNEEIMLDLDVNKAADLDLPPPPPPPQLTEAEERMLMAQTTLTAEDITYIDYTVVPLLLRAEMKYEQADKFGRQLKIGYTRSKIDRIMSNPFELFAALTHEGIEFNEDIKFNIIEDKFWGNGKGVEGPKRNSFVYYKETGSRVTRKKPDTERTSYRERASFKEEFGQEQIRNAGEQEENFMDALTQSLIELDKEFKEEEKQQRE